MRRIAVADIVLNGDGEDKTYKTCTLFGSTKFIYRIISSKQVVLEQTAAYYQEATPLSQIR